MITKPPSVIAVQCVSVFFMQQDYLKTRTITSALTPYIPVSTNFFDSFNMSHIFSDLYSLQIKIYKYNYLSYYVFYKYDSTVLRSFKWGSKDDIELILHK